MKNRLQSESQVVGYTSPFGLLGRLKRANAGLDWVPALDMVVIALLISLIFTRYVVVPGVEVALPATDLRMRSSEESVAVLTLQNRGMLFFNGSIYNQDSLEQAFADYNGAENQARRSVLLVKAEADIGLEAFLEICRLAESSGFLRVQLSGKKLEMVPELIPLEGERNTGGFQLLNSYE
ncbi:MAG: ExbD/TolR family protein [Coraliomargaritaceae bacterium]